MADPTAIVTAHSAWKQDANRVTRIIKDAEALKKWALAAHASATGKTEFADDVEGLIPCGIVLESADGNADHLTGDATYDWKAVLRGGIILSSVTVTGVSAITDAGKPVYATDGQTMTLARPAVGVPVGFVDTWVAGTTCDVYLYSFRDMVKMFAAKGIASGGKRIIDLGVIPTNALQGVAACNVYAMTQYEHYNILSLHAQCCGHDNAVVAGAQDLNIAIGGVDVTGGILSLANTDCDAAGDQGVAIDATAITAANEVHAGDNLIVEMAAGGTGFTADAAAGFRMWMVVEDLLGA